jgi:hypothetical protein
MKKVELIYIGRRFSLKDTILYTYIKKTDPNLKFYFKKPLITGLSIGWILSCEDNETHINNVKILGCLDDKNQITEWVIEDKNTWLTHESIRNSKKEPDNYLTDLIIKVKQYTKYRSRNEKNRIARYVFEQLIK